VCVHVCIFAMYERRGTCRRAYSGALVRGLDKRHLLGELLGEQRLHSLGVLTVPSCTAVLDLDLVRHL
jgi:hypothetical protein